MTNSNNSLEDSGSQNKVAQKIGFSGSPKKTGKEIGRGGPPGNIFRELKLTKMITLI